MEDPKFYRDFIENCPDVVENMDVRNCRPFDGDPGWGDVDTEDAAWRWVRPLNAKGVEALNNFLVDAGYPDVEAKDINDWLCIDVSGDAYLRVQSRFSDGLGNMKFFFSQFGATLEIE